MRQKIDYLKILNKSYQNIEYYDAFFIGGPINFNEKHILDYGSGNGKLFEYLIKKGVKKNQLYGVDIERKHLDYIKSNIGITNISLVDVKTQKTTLNSGMFDIIFCLDVIEHSDHPDAIIIEIKRLLKAHGTIIFCTPNRFARAINNEIFNPLKWLSIIKFNILRLLGKAFLDPTHVKEYSPYELKKLFKRHKLKIQNNNFFRLNNIPYLSSRSFVVHLKMK